MISRKHDGLLGLIGRNVDPIYTDTKAGRVVSFEGAITKDTAPFGYGDAQSGTRYEIRLVTREGDRQGCHTSCSLFEYAPQATDSAR